MSDNRTIIALGANKHYDVQEAGEPVHYRDTTERRISIVPMQQRLDDFKALTKKQKEEFLKKENLTEEQWLKMTQDMGDIFMSKFTLTFEEYDAYCFARNRRLPEDQGWGRGRRPAVNISIVDAVDYCNWINEVCGLSPKYILATISGEIWIWTYPGAEKRAKDYIAEAETLLKRQLTDDEKYDLVALKCHTRIPTSQEWIACLNRPNETFQYPGSNNLDEVAWFKDNSNNMTHPVGEKKPNSYDIYDLYGNVWEMCLPSEPPVMTEELWKQHFPGEKYLDFSNGDIFNVLQD